MTVKLSGIIKESIVDGPGFCYTIFFQGCHHQCYKCHNPKTHDINGGTTFDIDQIYQDIKQNKLIDGVTFSGGEPFLQKQGVLKLLEYLKSDSYRVIIYTGYTWDFLVSQNDEVVNRILQLADYLVDGPYIDSLRDISLLYRGSSNQRFIDLKKQKVLSEAEIIIL